MPLKKDSLELIKKLSNAHGAPNSEEEVSTIFKKELQKHGSFQEDKLGGIACLSKNSSRAEKAGTIVFAGHMDEVAFAVQSITSDGFLRFTNLGGWWTHNLLAQKVIIKNYLGKKIQGIITSTPPHFLSPAERESVLPIDKLFIDVGAKNKADAEKKLKIRIGDPIVPDSEAFLLNGKELICGKALDNRIGMALAIESIQNTPKNLKTKVYAAGTVQEEVGLRGAKTLARVIKPDYAFVLEAPPADDTPGFNRSESQGALSKGVQLRLMDPSAIMSKKLVNFCIDLCIKNKIPYQLTVRRSGGTDAGSFHLSNEGIPSIVIGVPTRYIHSHNSVANLNDYEAALKLCRAIVKNAEKLFK